MLSNEYVQLKCKDGSRLDFIPAVEFTIPAGEYVNLNHAQIDDNGKKLVFRAGQVVSINSTFVMPETKHELKEILLTKEISFPSRASIKTLQGLVNATL